MIPKHAVCNIDSEMLSQCIAKTFEKVSYAVLDWKGIKSEDKLKLLSVLQDVRVSFKKV
jgi:D-tyrosyl-tRNA(Tyr) deacylase